MELSVASGAVDGDQGGEDAHQEEDQHHVLREPNVLGGGGSGDRLENLYDQIFGQKFYTLKMHGLQIMLPTVEQRKFQ